MNLVKVISTEFDNAKKRIVKVLRFGKSDAQTPFETSPYGVDSNPVKGMVAVYAATGIKGKAVLIGYLNKNQLADVGETRLFSTDANGELKFYTWLKNDGTLELGGNANNLVKYTPLNTAAAQLALDINAELVKIAAGVAAGGGSYTPATISIDISGAKIDEIKTL